MNQNNYNQKLEHLYILLINKLNNNNKLEKKINQKFDILEKNINQKFNILEKNINEKFNIFEEQLNNNSNKISNIIFYLNLLYIQFIYKNFKNINNFLFKTKFDIIFGNNIYSIIKGTLINFNNNIIIKTNKNITYNIYYIIITFYNKDVLLNNYNFNYILKVKKINNKEILIVSDNLDYKKFYEHYLSTKYNNIHFYKIDQLIDKINN